MENENTKRENLSEETVDEKLTEKTEEIIESIVEDEAAEVEDLTEIAEADDVEEETDAEAKDDVIGDEWQTAEVVDAAVPETQLKELRPEELALLAARKKKKIRNGIIIAAIVAAVLAIAAFFVCYTEGFGGNTAVNKPLSMSMAEGKNDWDKLDNIRYQNPVVDAFEAVTGKHKTTALKVNGAAVDENIFNFFVNSTGLNCVYSLLQMGMVSDVTNFDWNAVDETSGLSYVEISKGMALDSIVPVYATLVEGEKRGVKLGEEDEKKIKDWIEEQKKNYGEDFEEVLVMSGYANEASLYEVQRMQVYMQKVYEDITANIDKYVSKDMMSELGDDKVTVKHILIQAETEDEKAEAKKEAEEVLAKAKSGEDFDKLIEEYNDDPGVASSPDGYTFANDGSMVQEFADASFALQIGQISELVETSYGYHIIKRMERVVTADDYIDYLGKTANVKIKKGVYDDMKVTINLSDYFGAPQETQPEETTENTNEAEAE